MDVEKTIEELRFRLQRLEDESAIRRLMTDMMHKADDREHPGYGERMAAFYTDDGKWTSGSGFADVAMSERGRAALRKKFSQGTRIRESSHLLGTESIEVDGDSADGTWLCFEPATLQGPGDGREAVWIMGRYACEFRRVDGKWRVRTVQYEGIFCTPYDKGWAEQRFVTIHPSAASDGSAAPR